MFWPASNQNFGFSWASTLLVVTRHNHQNRPFYPPGSKVWTAKPLTFRERLRREQNIILSGKRWEESKNFDLMAIRTLFKKLFPGRVYVHMLIERIYQCKNLRELEPFKDHFGAVASYLSISYFGRVMLNRIWWNSDTILLNIIPTQCEYFIKFYWYLR